MYSFEPFVHEFNLEFLGDFFRRCIGPKATQKMFVTSANQVRITSSSHRITSAFLTEIQDPCVEFVLHLVKNHSLDFGLMLGSLTSDLILSPRSIPLSDYEAAKSALEKFKLKVDISSVHQMISVIRAILVKLHKDLSTSSIPVNALEALLQSLPMENKDLAANYNGVHLLVDSASCAKSYVEKGFMYAIPGIENLQELRWRKPQKASVKILLANLMLKSQR